MATETQAASGAHEAASAPGMPQLDISTFPNQIFWLVVTLVAIYLILSRVALPRIGAILAERQGVITSDIAAAEDLKAKAVEAEAGFRPVETERAEVGDQRMRAAGACRWSPPNPSLPVRSRLRADLASWYRQDRAIRPWRPVRVCRRQTCAR